MARNTHILVVDDDESVHSLYRSIFQLPDGSDSEVDETLGDLFDLLGEAEVEKEPLYPVDLYTQGIDAVLGVRKSVEEGNPYSHALIDMRMPPGIDGLETAKKIFEIDPEIKVIFVTAYTDYTAEDIMEQVGDNYNYLQKPFSEKSILTQIEQK